VGQGEQEERKPTGLKKAELLLPKRKRVKRTDDRGVPPGKKRRGAKNRGETWEITTAQRTVGGKLKKTKKKSNGTPRRSESAGADGKRVKRRVLYKDVNPPAPLLARPNGGANEGGTEQKN